MLSRWRQDAEVAQLVKHFDQDKFLAIEDEQARWDEMTGQDARVAATELQKCQQSFEYVARNYFWIVDELGKDALFSLWPSQEFILDKMYGLKARGLQQKIITIKARRIGCSTLVEGLIAWRTMFFPNIYSLVVSVDQKHSAYLFGIMQHIYDRMPWWLRPMLDKLKYEEGLIFQNPDPDARRHNPGLNSVVSVQNSHQMAGVGQGVRISGAHISEFADYIEDRAHDIIEADMVPALMPGPDTFAVLESTPKGAGTYSEELWVASVEAEENADWLPIFIPWFYEKHRFLAPEQGWKVADKEERMRERVFNDWVRCDAESCGNYRDRWFKGEDRAGSTCPTCQAGTMLPFILADGQLKWMEHERINREKRGPDAIKKLRQEYASNAEESFQISGIQVFPDDTIDFVIDCLREPIAIGHFDDHGHVHGHDPKTNHCFQEWCESDHRFDPESPLRIWEWPDPEEKYVVGVDIAEGLGGKHDDSVAWVNRIGNAHSPDYQVAVFRSNTIDPMHFATPVNFIGRMYNEALMSIEYNVYTTVADMVRIYYQYPNLYRWKHPDAVARIESNQWHWLTQLNSKPKLWQTAVRWLRAKQWIVRDKVFAYEMKRFKKDREDSRSAGAASRFHDDSVLAGTIALYTSHDMDFDESAVGSPPYANQGVLQSKDWLMTCTRCQNQWPAANPEEEYACERCGCRLFRGKKNTREGLTGASNFEEMGTDGNLAVDPSGLPDYNAV